MMMVVGGGFVLALAAPFLYQLMPRVGGLLLPLYPLAGFVWFLSGAAPASERIPWAPSLGLELSFALDGLSRLFALLITGVGTLIAMMITYSLSFLVLWSLFLLFYWQVLGLGLGIPLGLDGVYTYGQ